MPLSVAVARNAMATRFEIVLFGDHAERLRAAGEEALDEIERLEGQLSIYRPESELSQINARADSETVRVEPQLFHLLHRAQSISEQTNGAFDITVGPLTRCWGFMAGSGRMPDPAEIEAARAVTGFGLVELNQSNLTVRFQRPGVMLDLGSIGKGYAIDRAVEILREAGIENAFLHGGTSTTAVLGRGPDGQPWRVAIEAPPETEPALLKWNPPAQPQSSRTLAIITLQDEALSVSAVWGKAFAFEGRLLGHIIDPRTGWPTCGSVLSAVVANSAADSDAYSTALMVMKPSEQAFPCDTIRRHLACHYLDGNLKIKSQGIATIHPDGKR